MYFQVEGTFYKCSINRMHLFDIWLSKTGSCKERFDQVFLEVTRTLPDVENVNIASLQSRIKQICARFMANWKAAKRTKSRMLLKYGDWLSGSEEFILARGESRYVDHSLSNARASCSTAVHRKDFGECCNRTKRRRIQKLSEIDDSAVNDLLQMSNERTSTSFSPFSTDAVLSLLVESKLTKHQYLLIREFVNSKFSQAFPSYHTVLEAKKKCYPLEETITESSAEVSLQSLLDHTSNRILESQKDVLRSLTTNVLTSSNFILIGKWGFDGSTGHSEYKQNFSDPSIVDDSSLFVTSYVPLKLVCKPVLSGSDTIIWKNPRPSSTRFCRPIRFQFAKETTDLSVQEETYFKNKIDSLVPSKFIFNDLELKVQHSLQLTMVDGKVCCALSDSSCSKCYICGATPKDMNDIDRCVGKIVNTSRFEFGLSPLHSWIRFFEYFIHLSYRLDFQKWQARSEEHKLLLAQKKKLVQNQFRDRLGLIVDKPRSGGSGTSNDGNTARKFFMNSEISAAITGIDKSLIDRCCTLLQCLSSGYNIDVCKFKTYALETARELVRVYPWYNLPASVHKVLIHGSEVIDNALLSIGELSEEAAEASNKNIKLFRRDNTRKMSRVVTNTDLLHRLLLSSDPFISSLRKLPKKKKSILSKEVFKLVKI